MAKTGAERQAAYRENRATTGDNGERRVNSWVSTGAYLALARLAKHYGLSRRAMLEKLITDADNDVIGTLRSNDEGFDKYIG